MSGRESETHIRYTKQQRNQLNIQLPLTKEMATVREKQKTKKRNRSNKKKSREFSLFCNFSASWLLLVADDLKKLTVQICNRNVTFLFLFYIFFAFSDRLAREESPAFGSRDEEKF